MSDAQTHYRRLLVIANAACPCPGLVQQASDLLDRHRRRTAAHRPGAQQPSAPLGIGHRRGRATGPRRATRGSRPSARRGAHRWLVAIRWTAGVIFVAFGIGKFVNHASELASFRLYGLPIPGAFTDATGGLEIVGGLLLAGGVLVRAAALALAIDMLGAIAVSGVGKGQVISLTLAPALLAAMILLSRPAVAYTALRGQLTRRLRARPNRDVI